MQIYYNKKSIFLIFANSTLQNSQKKYFLIKKFGSLKIL